MEPRKLSDRDRAANELTERLQRLVGPAKAGCQETMAELWEALIPMAERIAKNTCHRYPFVDCDDLANSMLLRVPNIVTRYDPNNAAGNSFSKYAYHRLFFTAKDVLRQRDDLGIMWPQKKPYPEFCRFGDSSMENYDAPDHHEQELDHLDEPQTVAADLVDLKTAVADAARPDLQPAAETAEQKVARIKERRRAANREWQRRNNAKRKAERAKAAAEKKAAEPPKPKTPDLVHKLQACKSLVAECGSLAAARESLEIYASLV